MKQRGSKASSTIGYIYVTTITKGSFWLSAFPAQLQDSSQGTGETIIFLLGKVDSCLWTNLLHLSSSQQTTHWNFGLEKLQPLFTDNCTLHSKFTTADKQLLTLFQPPLSFTATLLSTKIFSPINTCKPQLHLWLISVI